MGGRRIQVKERVRRKEAVVHPVVQDVAKPAGIRVVRLAVVLRMGRGRVPVGAPNMRVRGGGESGRLVVGRVDMKHGGEVEKQPCQRQQPARPTT